MKFKKYDDVKAFYNDTFEVLMRHEAQNMIQLGNILIGYRGEDKAGWRDPANWLMATVSDETGIRLTAIMTPPHNISLHATDNIICDEALQCLADGLLAGPQPPDAQAALPVPGVIAEKALAERFARIFAAASGTGYRVTMDQRIYELTKVNPDIRIIGKIRKAREQDLAFLPYWIEAFMTRSPDAPAPVQPDIGLYSRYVTNGKLFVLEYEGTPVSIAGINRELPNVCAVASVYTPPYFRNKGFATSCVAQLSQRMLDKGFSKCSLYTNLANPTSNSIYQKIGYTPICDSLEIKFAFPDNGV